MSAATVPPTLLSAAPSATAADALRPARHDAEATRGRLLASGLRLFALQGFARTSTRELAEDAGVNVAAISYHFGDKAGLYLALFNEPPGLPPGELAQRLAAAADLAGALRIFVGALLDPLRQGDTARLCMKLHYREMLEPTGLCRDGVAQSIRPAHDALLARLAAHFGLAAADDELQRLAVSIAGLAVHLHVGHDAIERLAPQLLQPADAIDRWAERLMMYALAMVQAEAARRAGEAVR
jgi:AcrR family transcriptional regulator